MRIRKKDSANKHFNLLKKIFVVSTVLIILGTSTTSLKSYVYRIIFVSAGIDNLDTINSSILTAFSINHGQNNGVDDVIGRFA